MNRLFVLLCASALTGCIATSPKQTTSTVTSPNATSRAVTQTSSPAPAPPQTSDTAPALARNVPLPQTNSPLKPIEPVSAPDWPVATVALPDDIWERLRKGFSIPDLDNSLVRANEQWYANRPEYMERMMNRANRYLYYIVEEVQARNMPLDLALLPFIESAFNPEAISRAKASGMWQFMPRTGTHFDLKQNAFRDDRLDVTASTRAALDYLSLLHAQFGDWHLALAAYNWGQGNVAKAQAANAKRGKGIGYEDLRSPEETRNYVPKFQAIKNIIANPQRFGLQLRVIKNHPYFQAVPLKVDMDVALAAELAELSIEELKQLNPSAKRPLLLGAATEELLLPWDNAEIFNKNFNQHTGRLASWTAWIAPRDLKPAQAADLVHMSEVDLREINDIPKNHIIRKGSALVVPRKDGQDDVSEQLADTGQITLMIERPTKTKVVRVQKGETVSSLARKYKVTPTQLRDWNQLKENQTLKPGQVLVISVTSAQPKNINKKAKNKTNTKAVASKATQSR